MLAADGAHRAFGLDELLLADEVARRLGEHYLGEPGLYLIIRRAAPEHFLDVVLDGGEQTGPHHAVGRMRLQSWQNGRVTGSGLLPLAQSAAFREDLAGPPRYDALHPTTTPDL